MVELVLQTGFSADLKLLSSLVHDSVQESIEQIVYAPDVDDQPLRELVRDLRAKGITVVQQLPGHPDEIKELDCTGILEKENQKWIVKPLGSVE